MKKKIKVSKEIIITAIINAILISIITILGKITVLNIMQSLTQKSTMRSMYIMYYNISFMLIGALLIVSLIINAKAYKKINCDNESDTSRSLFYNIVISVIPFILPFIFWIP